MRRTIRLDEFENKSYKKSNMMGSIFMFIVVVLFPVVMMAVYLGLV